MFCLRKLGGECHLLDKIRPCISLFKCYKHFNFPDSDCLGQTLSPTGDINGAEPFSIF